MIPSATALLSVNVSVTNEPDEPVAVAVRVPVADRAAALVSLVMPAVAVSAPVADSAVVRV